MFDFLSATGFPVVLMLLNDCSSIMFTLAPVSMRNNTSWPLIVSLVSNFFVCALVLSIDIVELECGLYCDGATTGNKDGRWFATAKKCKIN